MVRRLCACFVLKPDGNTIAGFLLLDALARSLAHSTAIGSAAVVVDAKDDSARAFYEHFNFITMPATPRRLYIPMSTIEALFHQEDHRKE